MLSWLDLFAGIGGISLGLERAGMATAAFCEINPHARQVLAKHWPGVPIYGDVTDLSANRLREDGVYVDAICGGFPCQDISLSGSGAGLDGARSGLWFEFLRLITEIRPKVALIENVAALRSRGLDQVLGGLASIGYDAEWHCIPASAVGAPHRRDRIWIVAYPNATGRGQVDSARGRVEGKHPLQQGQETSGGPYPSGEQSEVLAYPVCVGLQGTEPVEQTSTIGRRSADQGVAPVARTHKPRLEIMLHGEAGEQPSVERTHAWSVEPDVGRVAYGVPSRVDRITRLGNAVVPQIPEAIGRAITSGLQ